MNMPVGDLGRCANYNKAQKILGWEPQTQLNDGISELIKWLQLQ